MKQKIGTEITILLVVILLLGITLGEIKGDWNRKNLKPLCEKNHYTYVDGIGARDTCYSEDINGIRTEYVVTEIAGKKQLKEV